MSRTTWEKFVKVCPEVKAVQLKEPPDCRGADGKSIKVEWIVNLHLRLRTAAGSFRIAKPVECLIIPGDADEFLLGNDVLTMLGIDVQRQLEFLVAGTVKNELDDEFDDVDEPRIGSSVDLSDELLVAVEKLVEKAVTKGFPAELARELRRIAVWFDIWRLKLGDDPPARVPPMRVRLREGAKPYRCKARRYPPEVRNFLDEFNNELVRLGWVYENAESRWACPVLPVRKSGGEYRQTADYKPVNADIVAIVGVMPDLHVDLEEVKGAKFFGLFDFIKGYWQLALAEECQEWLSYMTHRKVYTPRRVPQGCTDAALFFQSTIQKCLEELLHNHLLVWIDDLLLFANDADTYLSKLERLFELLDFFGFKISPKKSSLFEKEVRWCGKLINGDGVHHDPERIRALQTLPYPTNAGELQQFLCATNWMRDSLIDYARKARPLQDALDIALAKASRRTKRIAAGIAVEFSDTERLAYNQMKEMLASSVTLAFPKDGATMCLLTDASDVGWSVLVSQVIDWQVDKEIQEQTHELLICLSGSFTGSQCNWSVIEKEAYPIVCACEKLSYLLLRPGGFRLYCDHRNLIYIFAPGKEVKKHIRVKLLRWSTKLMEYRYEVEHIDGEANVWADMISRWAGNHDPTVHLNAMTLRKRSPAELRPDIQPRRKRTRCRRKKTLVDDQQLLPQLLRPLDDPDFVWPSASVIRDTQQLHADCRPQVAVGDEENGWFIEDKVWIPRKAGDLVQRLLVVAHCGPQGHRGRDAMMESVGRRFNVHHLRARIENFLASCLMCKHVKGGKTIQRPWGPTFRTNERNGALHFDFLTLGESFSGDSYLLVLKDEATHFTELVPCSAPTSTVVVESILAWYSRFGVAPVWISDQGSHFKAEIVGELCRRLKARHEFTVVYSPWINGSVERANRDIMQVLRVMCLEYKVDTHDWTFFVPMLQASLNHTPVPSLGNAAPVELFCGLPLPSPLNLCMDAKQKIIMELPEQPEAIQTWLGKLRHSIHELHKPMIRERAQQTVRNKRMQKYARRPNFSVGDYVLRSRVDQKHHDKLLVTWVGPYQITRADPHSFQVRHLVTGALTDVHSSRLKFYADISLSITEELRDHVAAQGIVLSVGELKDSRWNEDTDDYEVLIGWKGLEPIEDSWEPVRQLCKDIPVLLTEFAATMNDKHFQRHIAAQTKLKQRSPDRPQPRAQRNV